MSQVPGDLRYTADHEWLRLDGDGLATVGITHYAQECLGDVTFVELPQVGSAYASGDTFGVVESVKAASDLYMPANCEVTEVNTALEQNPELINKDPYGRGWIAKVRLAGDADTRNLMSAEQYGDLI